MKSTYRLVLLGIMLTLPAFAQDKTSEEAPQASGPLTVQLQYTTPHMEAIRDFFLGLGFTKIEDGATPDPWILLTDGAVEYHIIQGKRLSICLGLCAPRINDVVRRALRKGVRFSKIYDIDGEYEDAKSKDPSGFEVMYFRRAVSDTSAGVTAQISHLGKLTCIAVPTVNTDTTLKYWNRHGFTIESETDEPYRITSITNGPAHLEFHQSLLLMRNALVYETSALPERIEKLKSLGIEFSKQDEGTDTVPAQAWFMTPDRQTIIVRARKARK
jgi:hypothetical protein